MTAALNIPAASLKVYYDDAPSPDALLANPNVLAVIGFANHPPSTRDTDPRYLRVPLRPLGNAPYEVWLSDSPVRAGRSGGVAWATDGRLSFGAIEQAELEEGVAATAERIYRDLWAHVQSSETPHLLRVWNYLDAITQGDGDLERYRQFCVGRGRVLQDMDASRLPAATAIGRCDDEAVLQVYWLSANAEGQPVENPRQISAYHYPRQYGPQPPSFARAMLPATGQDLPLLISGTAAVVGHASVHHGMLIAQIEETFRNFDALIGAAREHRPDLPERFGSGAYLKAYVRDRQDLEVVSDALERLLPPETQRIILHAAICRSELAIEIDGVHA